MAELRQLCHLLMMKVLSSVQDDDQQLASDIVASRFVATTPSWRLLHTRRQPRPHITDAAHRTETESRDGACWPCRDIRVAARAKTGNESPPRDCHQRR
jgi:hypothetical protein